MTPKEHLLLVTVITKQHQLIKLLLDILRSRGVLIGDDGRALEFAANVDAASKAAYFEEVKEKYVPLAKVTLTSSRFTGLD